MGVLDHARYLRRPTDSDDSVTPVLDLVPLSAWMDDAVTEPPQTARTHDRVDGVLARAIERGAVYRLDVPVDEELLHDYGWVVGVSGFHEYVSIDRDREAMHLVIASDD